MMIDGLPATVWFDADIAMFAGELLVPHGSADFYAPDTETLRLEGAISLRVLRETQAPF